MKHKFFVQFLILAGVVAALGSYAPAYATDCGGPYGASCPTGQTCNIPPGQSGGTCVAAGQTCSPACSSNQQCVSGQCVAQAIACNAANPCPSGQQCLATGVCSLICSPACSSGQICQNGSCVTPNLQGTTGGTQSNFVALTDFPAVTSIAKGLSSGGTGSLTTFFSVLYEFCIGIGATLAVLMIMYAGVRWMAAGDNMEVIGDARHKIGSAIFGLILVLSPVIVFSIVNPQVLQLNIDQGFSTLNISATTSSAPASGSTAQSTSGAASTQTTQSTQQCSTYDIDGETILPQGETCATYYESGDVSVSMSCCDDSNPAAGAVCCGHPNQ